MDKLRFYKTLKLKAINASSQLQLQIQTWIDVESYPDLANLWTNWDCLDMNQMKN